MRAKILAGLMFFSLLIPTATLAVDTLPEFNPFCWQKDECNAVRAEILNKDVKEINMDDGGWIENEDPCNKAGWGKCLPAGTTKTEIAFGGKQEFANIGEFLKTNYNLALVIAGILAVIMIIVAGVQWTTSGGNSEMITSAKKRISGALIGLLIAYLSYTILNTINPALINLQLPRTFLLRPSNVTPEYCRDAPAGTQFLLAAKKGQKPDVNKLSDPTSKLEVLAPEKMECGDKYFLGGAADATCMGSYCGIKGTSCLPFTTSGNTITSNMPNCETAQLAIHYSIGASIEGMVKNMTWFSATVGDQDWLDNNVFVVRPVCQRQGAYYIGDTQEEWSNEGSNSFKIFPIKKSSFYEYYVTFNNLAPTGTPNYSIDHWGCFKTDSIVGYIIKSELDTASWWGGNDANFYSSSKYTGPWYSITKNGFISVSSLLEGVLVDTPMDNTAVEALAKTPKNGPIMKRIDGTLQGNIVLPDEVQSAEQIQKELDKQIQSDLKKLKAGGGPM
ncbi:MAG: pilin [Candidatus Magasanikbacteria bacterium]|jgi:hypothetical protein